MPFKCCYRWISAELNVSSFVSTQLKRHEHIETMFRGFNGALSQGLTLLPSSNLLNPNPWNPTLITQAVANPIGLKKTFPPPKHHSFLNDFDMSFSILLGKYVMNIIHRASQIVNWSIQAWRPPSCTLAPAIRRRRRWPTTPAEAAWWSWLLGEMGVALGLAKWSHVLSIYILVYIHIYIYTHIHII